jgi:hypothetical protein
LEVSQTRDSAQTNASESYPAWRTDYGTKKKKEKLTEHIGIMVQNGGEIGRVESARGDRLRRPTLRGGIVNVDRSRVSFVHIKKVDGVCELPHKKLLSVLSIPKRK